MANITAVSKSFVHERHSIFVGKKHVQNLNFCMNATL